MTDTELAADLRALALALHRTEPTASQVTAISELLATARDELAGGGETRLRWYEANGDRTRARNRDLSAFSGSLNAVAPPMRIETGSLDDGQPCLVGAVTLDRLREGPPGSVHGGVIAGLFDELGGAAQRLTGGVGGVTARMTVRYRQLTPLGEPLEFRAWIVDERTRRIVVRADCRAAGAVTAEADLVFLRRPSARRP